MSTLERYRRQRDAKDNAGKPLGGGLDGAAAALPGRATVADLMLNKPVEREGRAGLEVQFRLDTEKLSGARLVVETTFHDQIHGPLKSREPAFANALGVLEIAMLYRPADDEPASASLRSFLPFAAIEVEREGTLKCFARVRVLEENRGCLAEDEIAFELTAG